VEEAAAAVFDEVVAFVDEAGISEPEQEALTVQEEDTAEVMSESPEKLQLTRLLQQYGLEDEADMLAGNGIKKYRDLSFIDEDVIKEMTLSIVSKAKLKKLVKALGAAVPEETSETVKEAGDKVPAEEATAAPDAQDAIEESVET
jgi:hypothetical protein